NASTIMSAALAAVKTRAIITNSNVGLKYVNILPKKKINKVIKNNFFLSIFAFKDNKMGPAIEKTKAKTVISCPAVATDTSKSPAIIGKTPPTTNSTNPTVTAVIANKNTRKSKNLLLKLKNKQLKQIKIPITITIL